MKRTLLRMALVAGSLLAVAIPASANQATFSSIDNAIICDGGSALLTARIGNQAIKKIEGVGEILKVDIGGGSSSIMAIRIDKAAGYQDPFEGIRSNAIDKQQARGSDEHLMKQPDIGKSLGANTRPIGGDDRSVTATTTMKQQPFGSDLGKRGRIDQAYLSPASLTVPSIGAIDGLSGPDQQSGLLTNIT